MNIQSKKISKRVRSPNYPNYSLRECVAFLEKLYKKYGIAEIHSDDAVTQAGHSPTSSSAPRVLASLLSFGLLESRGSRGSKFVSLSRLAHEIVLEGAERDERLELLRKAALNDSSMLSVWNKWGPNLPSEETIRKSLELEMHYSKEGAKRFASVVVDTYDFTELNKASISVTDDESDDYEAPDVYAVDEGEQRLDVVAQKANSSVRKANFLLPGRNREIIIYAPEDLTEREFEMILKWLELQKFGLIDNGRGGEG